VLKNINFGTTGRFHKIATLIKVKNLLKDEKGQVMPFLAICLLIMIGFAAVSLGLSMAYRDRMIIRDALDAAAAAATSQAERAVSPTEYGEKKHNAKRDDEGNIIRPAYWTKTEGQYVDYVVLNDTELAQTLARSYFEKNMVHNGLSYKIKSWDLKIKFDKSRRLQVHKHRPHTEGIVDTWEKDFPRYVKVEITARIESKSPMGAILGKDMIVTGLSTTHYRELDN
jgi:hypothetical protein